MKGLRPWQEKEWWIMQATSANLTPVMCWVIIAQTIASPDPRNVVLHFLRHLYKRVTVDFTSREKVDCFSRNNTGRDTHLLLVLQSADSAPSPTFGRRHWCQLQPRKKVWCLPTMMAIYQAWHLVTQGTGNGMWHLLSETERIRDHGQQCGHLYVTWDTIHVSRASFH